MASPREFMTYTVHVLCRFLIRIEYETDPKSTALQWLTPEQTAGGKLPYLFSQCEVNLAKSFFFCHKELARITVSCVYSRTIADLWFRVRIHRRWRRRITRKWAQMFVGNGGDLVVSYVLFRLGGFRWPFPRSSPYWWAPSDKTIL